MSEQEQERARQFVIDDKRHQFVTTRARLRQCLALAMTAPIAEIEIETSASGKPILGGSMQSWDIQFNVSHTDGLALIAITRGQAIGIDVERLRHSDQHRQMAADYFSEAENSVIQCLPADLLTASFFACWTRKEAVVKALGSGLAGGLDSFDVSVDPETVRCQTTLGLDQSPVESWWVENLACGEGFAGALAFRNQPIAIHYWQ